jgi:hypothetical protein
LAGRATHNKGRWNKKKWKKNYPNSKKSSRNVKEIISIEMDQCYIEEEKRNKNIGISNTCSSTVSSIQMDHACFTRHACELGTLTQLAGI